MHNHLLRHISSRSHSTIQIVSMVSYNLTCKMVLLADAPPVAIIFVSGPTIYKDLRILIQSPSGDN